MQLVEDWRKAWKWFSVHAMVYAAAIQGTWLQLPDDIKTRVPESLVSGATIALLVLGVIGRIVKQEKDEDDNKPQD